MNQPLCVGDTEYAFVATVCAPWQRHGVGEDSPGDRITALVRKLGRFCVVSCWLMSELRKLAYCLKDG